MESGKLDNRSLEKRLIQKSFKRDKMSFNRKVHMKHRDYDKARTHKQSRQTAKRFNQIRI